MDDGKEAERMSMHKRKKPILPEQEFPEKKCVLIGIVIGVSLGLLLGVTCGSLLCGSLPLGICIGGAAGFCLGNQTMQDTPNGKRLLLHYINAGIKPSNSSNV